MLSHILGSNAEICGYKELHLPYRNRMSLLKMRAALLNSDHYRESTFLLDKVLHNALDIYTDVFRGKLKLLILLREPLGSVSSMLRMHEQLYGGDNYSNLINYYIDRLAYIASFVRATKESFLFIDSDSLISDTDGTLEKIRRYLGLGNQLAAHYKRFSETGVPGVGDPGNNITAGKIIRTRDNSTQSGITVEDSNRLLMAYSESERTAKELSYQ